MKASTPCVSWVACTGANGCSIQTMQRRASPFASASPPRDYRAASKMGKVELRSRISTSFRAFLGEAPLDQSYSQHFEDVLVKRFSEEFGVSLGAYVDIGCNDPVHLNNTYHFYRR